MKKYFIALLMATFVITPAWAISNKQPTAPTKASGKTAPKKAASPAKTAKQTPPPTKASAQKPPPAPPVPYKAFIVVEAQTGKMLEGENIHQPLPPASITKLMLAAIVMERLESGQIKLDDRVTVSQEAAAMGGSQVYLKPGETFSLDEMMKAVMVASANDAAYSVAEFVAGSRENFVDLMNEKARSLNMADSRFHSMHGLPPSQGQNPDMTSCADLAILAGYLLAHPGVLEWTSLKTAPFRNNTLIMQNHNRLMNRFSGMDGLKTGFFREAGYSIAATARVNNLRLIAVVMGSSAAKIRDSFAENKLKTYFSQYEMITVIKKGDSVDKDVSLPDGKQKSLKPVAATDFFYPVPRDKKKQLSKEFDLPDQIKGEIKEGQRLGEIVIRFNKDAVGKVDLISPVNVPKAGFFSRFFNIK
ncbi:MAG: D-alanyl-D-alanine carboxypeptidase [Deltaproteobacteria bacterium]|nr:D-alanyl-D-alanine carboxypeptidase [Deltaproteobacteria bacterium]